MVRKICGWNADLILFSQVYYADVIGLLIYKSEITFWLWLTRLSFFFPLHRPSKMPTKNRNKNKNKNGNGISLTNAIIVNKCLTFFIWFSLCQLTFIHVPPAQKRSDCWCPHSVYEGPDEQKIRIGMVRIKLRFSDWMLTWLFSQGYYLTSSGFQYLYQK